MGKLSPDGTYVTVERGDTLSIIAKKFSAQSGGKSYQQLAAINGIRNANLIYVGQQIYLNGGGATPSSSKTVSSFMPTNVVMGLMANPTQPNTDQLFATWTFDNPKTEEFYILWRYAIGNLWMSSVETKKLDIDNPEGSRQAFFNVPAGAYSVQFKVKPIAKKEEVKVGDGTESRDAFQGQWSELKTWDTNEVLVTPPAPHISLDKLTLKLELTGIESPVNQVEFEIVRNDSPQVWQRPQVWVSTGHCVYTTTVEPNTQYKARCRYMSGVARSKFSPYSEIVTTIPATPDGFKSCLPLNRTEVKLTWDAVPGAKNYDIQYVTESPTNFDITSKPQNVDGINDATEYVISGLTSGEKYYFRFRASDTSGNKSGWSKISSVENLGIKPNPPTAWSLSNTIVLGEPMVLYWVHNARDNAKQTAADIRIVFKFGDGRDDIEVHPPYVVPTGEDDVDKTNRLEYDYSQFPISEGVKIQWQVRTQGLSQVVQDGQVIQGWSEYSTLKEIYIYAQPTISSFNVKNYLTVSEAETNKQALIDYGFTETQIQSFINREHTVDITQFPIFASIVASRGSQLPISYYISIVSGGEYTEINQNGDTVEVHTGDVIYTNYYDISTDLFIIISANNINLEPNIPYTIICECHMNSGLKAIDTYEFSANWVDSEYSVNAEIRYNETNYTTIIRPYLSSNVVKYRKVTLGTTYLGKIYIPVYGPNQYCSTSICITKVVTPGTKNTYIQKDGGTFPLDINIYYGVDENGTECMYYEETVNDAIRPDNNVLFSVYRRNYDNTLTEISKDISQFIYDSSSGKYVLANTSVVDPHPALNYARYRIVATNVNTGSVTYADLPGYLINCGSIIIQWDEEWRTFENPYDIEPDVLPWTGSLLKLDYNIDTSPSYSKDVVFVEFMGREHPVAYYGTQLGEAANWSAVIAAEDDETLYALIRLANWRGNVYAREPSGVGFWASINVQYNINHDSLTIPVTLSLTRIEGGS